MTRVNVERPAVIVLVGPSGSGKSAWAAENFADSEVVSSDRLRAVAGTGESDLNASEDAFVLLRQIVSMRCKKGLTTVVDTLGFDADLRHWLIAVAGEAGLPVHAVVFDTPDRLCKERNALRTKRVSIAVLRAQTKKFAEVRAVVLSESFTSLHAIQPSDSPAQATSRTSSQSEPAPNSMGSKQPVRFGLQVSSFPGPAATLRPRLAEWTQAAESVGFDSLWVMDHFRQIPQVGREWDDMPESIALLNFLAAHTSRVSLGALVHCVTHRNLGLLGKSLATLDVLSGGRAFCGLGLGWFAAEHKDYGLDFPSVDQRYALLEDALQFLPLLWGKGAPAFTGKAFNAPRAIGYPRPLQARIPILVGGGGERRTLRLAAQYADACNLFGHPDAVRHKIEVVHRHCAAVQRDPLTLSVTHLGSALVGTSAQNLAEQVDAMRIPARVLPGLNPGSIEDHVVRVTKLIETGVDHLIVSLPNISTEAITRFGHVIASVRHTND